MLNAAEAAKPVFVDGTGRRSRLFAAVGFVGGTVLVLATAGLLAGFIGAGAGVLPGLPATAQTPGASRLLPAPVTHPSSHPAAPTSAPPRDGRTTPPPAPSPTSAAIPAPATASPSPTSRRNVPTQTPSHGPKR